MKCLILLCCSLVVSGAEVLATEIRSEQSLADTTQIKIDLDSAWKWMQKRDPRTIQLSEKTLRQSRLIDFKLGEGNSFYTLAKHYGNEGKSALALAFYDSALNVFQKLNNDGKIAQCYHAMGNVYLLDNKFPLAIEYYNKAMVINTALGKKGNVADGLTNLGLAYEKMGDYPRALDFYLQCLKIDEELDYKPGVAQDYGVLATVYGKMGQVTKAYELHEKSIALSKGLGDEFLTGTTLTNYGILLKNNGQFEKAGQCHEEALKIFEKLGSSRGIYGALHNMGALAHAKGEYRKALDFYNRSLKSVDDNNQDAFETNYLGMAETYFALKEYNSALEYANKVLLIVNRIMMLDDQVKVTKLISDIYNAQGNHKQSLAFYQLYTVHKDSLFNLNKSRQFTDLQTKYETEKKEQEINSLTQERKLQDASLQSKNIIQYSLIAGIILLAGFGFIIFQNNKAKQEAKRLLLDEQLKNEHVEAEKLKELDQLKSRFFANIAHEFRTPLTLILGPVENLIGESKEGSEKNQLMIVKSNANRLVKLVNQLLDLSKLEAGAIRLDYVYDDVISFLKANTFAFQSLADQKNIHISFESNVPALPMRFDRDKLEKIFSNLLSNAFKFTNPGGQVSVSVQISEGESRIMQVTVKDSGAGIPQADLPYVFNRFYQSGTVSRSTLGSGIGLELTKELVEICGGEIGVTNSYESGARFYFTLPVIEGEADARSEVSTSQLSSFTKIALDDARTAPDILTTRVESENQELILVIEDNEEVRDYIVSALQSEFTVITAEDGQQGIVKTVEAIPDLIITDVMMPFKDGLEVCKTLKDDEKTSHIPIVMLTAKADVESRIEGFQTGADDYLAKPFHTKELVVRVKNLIQQRKKLQEKFKQVSDKKVIADDAIPLKEKQFINRLRETIELHLAEEEYSVEELSRDMAMSRMQLHRKLKALTNTSASLYIRSIRLMHAKRLLEEGIYNVSEVAYRVGFNSPTYFSTCFSEEFGIPPSEFRMQQV